MRVLTCGEARDLAADMLDGEIDEEDQQAVLAHVASCGTCPGLYRAMVLLQAELSRSGNAQGRMTSDG